MSNSSTPSTFSNSSSATSPESIDSYESTAAPQTVETISYEHVAGMSIDWVYVWLVNCTCSLVGYFVARSAAKMLIQRLTYALPVLLTTPLMFGLMIGGCEIRNDQPCAFVTSELDGYLNFRCYAKDALGNVWLDQMWFVMPLMWLSQMWIAWHIWFPKSERLAKSEK